MKLSDVYSMRYFAVAVITSVFPPRKTVGNGIMTKISLIGNWDDSETVASLANLVTRRTCSSVMASTIIELCIVQTVPETYGN